LFLQNLQQGLQDQSVDDARHAELSDPTLRLGDFDPLDRLRLVGSREQLRPNGWPVLTQVVPGVVDGHPIDAGAALVLANAFPRSYKILSVAHPSINRCPVTAGLSGAGFATNGSVPWKLPSGVSPRSSGSKASTYWICCHFSLVSCQAYLSLGIVRAFGHRFRLGLSVAPPLG
jgi:hypothetical protein